MTAVPLEDTPVAEHEDLRRAAWRTQVDDEGRIMSVAFSYKDISLDVASLCALDDSRRRFARSYIAVLACRSFVQLGYQPLHKPVSTNVAHAEVPGRIKDTARRALAIRVTEVYSPLE